MSAKNQTIRFLFTYFIFTTSQLICKVTNKKLSRIMLVKKNYNYFMWMMLKIALRKNWVKGNICTKVFICAVKHLIH